MKKISILSLHLGYGGIEKSIVTLANSLCNDFDVEIISTYKLAEESAFKINSKVQVRYLIDEVKPNREEWKRSLEDRRPLTFLKESYKSVLCLFLRRSRTIAAIKKCDSDILISTRDMFNTWLGKYGSKKCKKVAWEHNHHHGNEKYANKLVASCRKIDTLILVSDSLRNYYKKRMKEKKYKCRCIFIPNTLDEIPKKLSALTEERIISVGRFSREKGMPDLIDVFQLVHEQNPNLRLELVGDGTQRNMIVDKIYEYGLEQSITVHGFLPKEEIQKLFQKSSLYIMTSFTESFGIVLIEAMSFGLPCIAFSSAEGACDLIESGKDGYLIQDRNKEKMAEKIVQLMKDLDKRKELGRNAREKSLNYTPDITKNMWIKILK